MGVTILEPTAEREGGARAPLAQSGEQPATIALVDIRKPRSNVFLDQLERLLRARGHDGHCATAKPTFTSPRRRTCARDIAQRCDAMIEALADEAPACRAVCATCVEFEALEEPAVLVASSAFAQAAADQARAARPAEAAPTSSAPHPIQDRADDELRAMARGWPTERWHDDSALGRDRGLQHGLADDRGVLALLEVGVGARRLHSAAIRSAVKPDSATIVVPGERSRISGIASKPSSTGIARSSRTTSG